MNQLYHLIGHEKFSNNLGSYFHTYKWSNSTLDDFIQKMEQNIEDLNLPFTLNQWNKDWIQTAGLNEVEAQPKRLSENQVHLTLKQSAALAEHPLLRYHKMKIGFFNAEGQVV